MSELDPGDRNGDNMQDGAQYQGSSGSAPDASPSLNTSSSPSAGSSSNNTGSPSPQSTYNPGVPDFGDGGFNPYYTQPGADKRALPVDGIGAERVRQDDLNYIKTERQQDTATSTDLAENTISAAVNVEPGKETIPVESFNIGGGEATTSVTFNPDPDGTLTITIETDVEESGREPGYRANATITIEPAGDQQEIASEVIGLLRQRFEDRLKDLKNKPNTLPIDKVAQAMAERGERMQQYAPENQIDAADIIELLRGADRDLKQLEKETPESFKTLAGDPELSLKDIVTVKVQSIGLPEVGEVKTDFPAPADVAVVNPEAEQQPDVAVVNESLSQDSTPFSGTLAALSKWAGRYNANSGNGDDVISSIESVEPRGVSVDPRGQNAALPQGAGSYSMADCQRAFGRYEAFKITDTSTSESQWEAITVERNIDGTFLRLEKGGAELEFRIGSRNMSQEALEARLDEFMPLMTGEGDLKIGRGGRVTMKDCELLTRLCRTDKGNAEVTLTSAKNITFDRITIGNASLDNASFENCTFKDCVLSASMRNTKFIDCVVKGKSQINITDAEGLEISGKKSVWKSTVDVSGTVKGATIGGRSFACNTLGVPDWH